MDINYGFLGDVTTSFFSPEFEDECVEMTTPFGDDGIEETGSRQTMLSSERPTINTMEGVSTLDGGHEEGDQN